MYVKSIFFVIEVNAGLSLGEKKSADLLYIYIYIYIYIYEFTVGIHFVGEKHVSIIWLGVFESFLFYI